MPSTGTPLRGTNGTSPKALACDLFGIPHMTKEHKARVRDLIRKRDPRATRSAKCASSE
jgi:hypothetical protein